MDFLTIDDIRIVVDEDTFEVINQGSAESLDLAEREAIEEISGYLRSRYDCNAIFSATGTDRNQQIVMITNDIMLYHLVSWLPKRLGYEIREIRYNMWLKWLQEVQAGKITPNLPGYQSSDGTGEDTSHYRFQYGSMKHQPNVY